MSDRNGVFHTPDSVRLFEVPAGAELSRAASSDQRSSCGDPTEGTINQGVIGINYWTGVDVDPGVMRAKLEEIFG
jgi:hypothetical protein